MTDYSQFGEQAVIARHVPAVGRFLDIGAWDAETFSNTRSLYLAGWSGVMVEPHPSHAARLRRSYAVDERVRVIEAAVGVEAGSGRLRATDDAMSTLDPTTYAKWEGVVAYEGEFTVSIITVDTVWSIYGPFDFVSIDAEGWSVPILHDLLDHGYRPDCICVEYDASAPDVVRAGRAAGYRSVLLNGTNVVLARSE